LLPSHGDRVTGQMYVLCRRDYPDSVMWQHFLASLHVEVTEVFIRPKYVTQVTEQKHLQHIVST